MVRSARLQRIAVSGSVPMDRVREVLARQRAQLVDRWDRQLLAAAEAGFGLDPATGELLPELLAAVDRALERRYRAPEPGLHPARAEAHRWATRSSLLRDFLFDTTLESYPDSSAAERRLLADALAHAAVEVQVRMAVERAQEKQRREGARIGRVAHDLRNSLTAARLAFDLLRRKGQLGDSRDAHALEKSLARLRDSVEDALFDEALAAGTPRLSRVRLGPVLRDAHEELRTCADGVQVLLTELPPRLLVAADPRLVRPVVRGLLRAALQVARPGSTVRFGANAARHKARVAVTVEGCRKLAGDRLADLPALSLVRRATRAQGGSFVARRFTGNCCEFRIELPAASRARPPRSP
jgi:signal transduction histidine kinase